jgi:hypothetical protein
MVCEKGRRFRLQQKIQGRSAKFALAHSDTLESIRIATLQAALGPTTPEKVERGLGRVMALCRR